jgi:hypothetical protein
VCRGAPARLATNRPQRDRNREAVGLIEKTLRRSTCVKLAELTEVLRRLLTRSCHRPPEHGITLRENQRDYQTQRPRGAYAFASSGAPRRSFRNGRAERSRLLTKLNLKGVAEHCRCATSAPRPVLLRRWQCGATASG